ncbi:hypothetical protein D9615_010398 [Tricholomella constricta]|uniref:Uncharacterized protein n=1 Tax=Tricholomella constricta TaxID=117010 RepID=A0A8H5GPN9_9AGAR|nr:hypothetical protein D9615_010398 [Tricholomella constricta]
MPSIDPDRLEMLPRPTSPTRHAARAADISRLLDPSYSSNAYASSSAYVDRHGDLHDPDFRHFPIAAKRPSSRSHAYNMATRPRWELVDEDALDDDDEEEHYVPRHRDRYSSINARRHPRDSHSNSFSSYQQQRPMAYTFHPTPTYSHHHHHHHTPHSFDSDETVLDEYDEHDGLTNEDKASSVSRIILRTKREFAKKRRSLDGASRRSTDSSSPTSKPTAVSEAPEDAASLLAPSHHHPLTHTLSHQSYSRRSQHSRASFHSEREQPSRNNNYVNYTSASTHDNNSNNHHHHHHPEPSPAHDYTPSQDSERDPVWTPTCTQALRRQWQALSLRVRFGLFRAQRRMKSRLATL